MNIVLIRDMSAQLWCWSTDIMRERKISAARQSL